MITAVIRLKKISTAKHRQVSLKRLLLIVSLIAAGIAVSQWFRPATDYGSITLDARPALIVPEDFDLNELSSLVNGAQFHNELMASQSKHERILSSWVDGHHGVKFQHVAAGSFQMVVLYPCYAVKQRELGWSGFKSELRLSGESKLDNKIMEQNEELRSIVLRSIYRHVNELSDGNFETTDEQQYVPVAGKRSGGYLKIGT